VHLVGLIYEIIQGCTVNKTFKKCANVSKSSYNVNHLRFCYEGDCKNKKNKMYQKKTVTRTPSARIITPLFVTSVLKLSPQKNSMKCSRARFADV